MKRTCARRPGLHSFSVGSALAGLLFALLICSSGCTKEPQGGPRITTVPVTGKIQVDGKPAKGVFVIFKRMAEPGVPFNVPEAQGVTDEGGLLTKVSTYMSNDGAPPGEFKLLFEWPNAMNPLTGEASGDAFRGKYMTMEKAKILVTIAPGEGGKPCDIGTIELTTKAESNK